MSPSTKTLLAIAAIALASTFGATAQAAQAVFCKALDTRDLGEKNVVYFSNVFRGDTHSDGTPYIAEMYMRDFENFLRGEVGAKNPGLTVCSRHADANEARARRAEMMSFDRMTSSQIVKTITWR